MEVGAHIAGESRRRKIAAKAKADSRCSVAGIVLAWTDETQIEIRDGDSKKERCFHPLVTEEVQSDMKGEGKKRVQRWVVVEIEEAYIHCSKHIPFMRKDKKDVYWGTDSQRYKGGDYFAAKGSARPWTKPSEGS